LRSGNVHGADGSKQPLRVKTGRRLAKLAQCEWLRLAETDLTRRLSGRMPRRMEALALFVGNFKLKFV
jgi:hypothetical protein